MKTIRLSRILSLLISFSLLVGPLPLTAIARDMAINISTADLEIINENSGESYLYIGEQLSNIVSVIAKLALLDERSDSPLHELPEYIERGFSCARQDDLLAMLRDAEEVLLRNYEKIDPSQAYEISQDLTEIMQKIINGELTVYSQDLTRSGLRTLVIDENLHVVGKTVLDKHLHGKEGAHFHGHLKVGKSSKFKKSVKIKGDLSVGGTFSTNSLSVTDLAVASCVDNLCINNLSSVDATIDNLTLTGGLSFTNLSVVDQTVSGTLSVNDLVVINCMSDLCVNNLSAVDQSISGTLSVNDAVIQNLTLTGALSFANLSVTDLTSTGTLSANDAVIQDLTVTNCIANLCVNNLSVVDESVSGTLSATNEIIKNDLRFNDAAGGQYVGIQAPAVVPTSNTCSSTCVHRKPNYRAFCSS